MCPGMYLGMTMMELALANFLYKFDREMPSGIKKEDLDFEIRSGIITHKKNPLSLIAWRN